MYQAIIFLYLYSYNFLFPSLFFQLIIYLLEWIETDQICNFRYPWSSNIILILEGRLEHYEQ